MIYNLLFLWSDDKMCIDYVKVILLIYSVYKNLLWLIFELL